MSPGLRCIRCDLRERGIETTCRPGECSPLSWAPSGRRGRDGVARVALLLDADAPGADRTVVLFEGDEGPDQRLGYVYGPAWSILAWCSANRIAVR